MKNLEGGEFMGRFILIVLDGLGVGAMPDAAKFNDQGSNTFGNLHKTIPDLQLPNLKKLGLYHLIKHIEQPTIGAYGKMALAHKNKDTTGGHWEMAGVTLEEPLPVFPNGFPSELMAKFETITGYSYLGNKVASGTEIINELGCQHLKTGYPIVYTSADSVFQVAAHQEVIPLAKLYEICSKARKILQGPYGVGRVIARPFVGTKGAFKRTPQRRDFSLTPPQPTILDLLQQNGFSVIGIGKIADIFAGQGITKSIPTKSNQEGINTILACLHQEEGDLLFANLIDFDMLYGHRNDPEGFAKALMVLDQKLPSIMEALNNDDILVLTADHGVDPTFPGTDHTREYVPLLVYGGEVLADNYLGVRKTLADIQATIATFFNIEGTTQGKSFYKDLYFKK